MKTSTISTQSQAPWRPVLVASAAFVAAATLLSLKSPAGAHAGVRAGATPTYAASATFEAVPLAAMHANADPALVRLIDLHRRATRAPGVVAYQPQGGACCVPAAMSEGKNP